MYGLGKEGPLTSVEDLERAWWDRFGDIAERQWSLNEELNLVVRREHLAEVVQFLRRPGGRLLDVGCGSGWLGLLVASTQMELTGVDFSLEQVSRARQAAFGKGSARFILGTIDQVEDGPYDSALLHGVLHHLPEFQIEPFLDRLAKLMAPGGRIYLYEPIARAQGFSGGALAGGLMSSLVWGPFWIMREVGLRLVTGPAGFRRAVRQGWDGFSPIERPLAAERVLSLMRARLESVSDLTYWHAFSLAFAMGCTELRAPLSYLARLQAMLLYRIDRILLRSRLRRHIYGVWTFASLTAIKRG